MQPALARLREVLLAEGGEEICVNGIEEHLKILLERGQPYRPEKIQLREGEAGRCHSNISHEWLLDERLVLITGYCLDDGVWRSHSWGRHGHDLVETTFAREDYFGAELRPDEAREFVNENCP